MNPPVAADHEVWILGASGRSGRRIAAILAANGVPLALVGRDGARLSAAAAECGGIVRTIVAPSGEATATEIRRQHPRVVVNAIGPFASTAAPIARTCLAGGDYLDLGNDVIATQSLLDLHQEAVDAGHTLVTGAGFGVLATEALVVEICRDRPAAARVRVDAVPSVELEAGPFGEALAATIIEGLPHGGGLYENGRLMRARLGSHAQRLTLPDGSTVTTGSWPSGELLAAQRASRAPDVIAATSEVPTSRGAQAIIPLAERLLAIRPIGALATRRLAGVKVKARPRPRPHSWAHAHVQWANGTHRDGWLRTEDASTFTNRAAAAVATRLGAGRCRPGVYTPAAAFGPDLAQEAGGKITVS